MHLDRLFTFNLYNVFIFLELLMQIRNFHIPLVSFAAVLQSEVCLPAKIIPVSSVNLCKLCSSTQASVQVTDVDQCGFHTGACLTEMKRRNGRTQRHYLTQPLETHCVGSRLLDHAGAAACLWSSFP